MAPLNTRGVVQVAVFALLATVCERGDERTRTTASEDPSSESLARLAECLGERGWVMYGSATCSACRAQRKAFGAAFSAIAEVECNPHAPGAEVERCLLRNIRETPTWVSERNGQEFDRLEGYQLLPDLARQSGCWWPDT